MVLIVPITNMSHKAHLLNCALRCSSKLQEIQSLEFLFQWLSKVQKYQYTQTHTILVFFSFFNFFFFEKQIKQKLKTNKQKQANNYKA